jgi:hypothetical protein
VMGKRIRISVIDQGTAPWPQPQTGRVSFQTSGFPSKSCFCKSVISFSFSSSYRLSTCDIQRIASGDYQVH